MIVRIEYGDRDHCVEIDLLDTVAAKKWLFTLNENLKIGNPKWRSYCSRLAKYVHIPGDGRSAHSQNLAYQKIQVGIDGVNKHSKGARFPYKAKLDMNWTETQQIHRAFTTSMTTLKTYEHGLDVSQLMKLKFCDVKERHDLLKKWTPRDFDITDIDKFIHFAHMINEGIHDYEPHLESDRSLELKHEGFWGMQVWNQWKTKPKNGVGIFLTPSELETSFEHFMDCDVYIHSNIFGKPYLETYLENDPPLEYDVSNVEIVTGEFSYYVGDIDQKKKFFTDSPFQRWMDETKTWAPGTAIPKHLILPVPIGRIVGSDNPFMGPTREMNGPGPYPQSGIETWQSSWREFVSDKPTTVRVKWQQDQKSITVDNPVDLYKEKLF